MPAETSIYKFSYPLESDAPDGAAQIKTLAEALDAEKWLSRSVKLTAGVKSGGGTEPQALTEAYAEVPGAKLEITPAVASVLLVVAIFDFAPSGSVGTYIGTLGVDGEDQAVEARWKPSATSERATIAQAYSLSLTAALHTIKMRVKREGGGGFIYPPTTRFIYALVAS